MPAHRAEQVAHEIRDGRHLAGTLRKRGKVDKVLALTAADRIERLADIADDKERPAFLERPFETQQDRSAQASSWAVIGVDTSLTAVSVVVHGYDSITDSTKTFFDEIRWMPEVDWFERLRAASKTDALVNSLVVKTWTRNPKRTYVGVEESWPTGMVNMGQSGHLRQQAEVQGVVKASLYSGGYSEIREVNNSSWRKTLRESGVPFEPIPRGTVEREKKRIKLANKALIKTEMMAFFDLPDLPDLVKAKNGSKIPRPESGFGAKAAAVQPSDVYDAAAVALHLLVELEREGSI